MVLEDPTTRPQIGEHCHHDVVRNPKKYKGLRQQFRTQLKAPKDFKYRTELLRNLRCLAILVRKGDIDVLRTHVEDKFSRMEFEGWPIKIFRK